MSILTSCGIRLANLKEDIERRLASNQVYYAHFVDINAMKLIREQTTNDIIAIIEKHVASLKRGELYRAYNAALEDLEEILKK